MEIFNKLFFLPSLLQKLGWMGFLIYLLNCIIFGRAAYYIFSKKVKKESAIFKMAEDYSLFIALALVIGLWPLTIHLIVYIPIMYFLFRFVLFKIVDAVIDGCESEYKKYTNKKGN